VAAGNIDIVDADAGAADHFQPLAFSRSLAVTLVRSGCKARRKPPIAAAAWFLVLPKFGWKSHGYAAVLENLNGGGRKRIGDQNTGVMDYPLGQRISAACGEKGEGFFRAHAARSYAVGLQERHGRYSAGGGSSR